MWLQEIAGLLGKPLGKMDITRFMDGELNIKIHDNVRGKDIFLIQPTCAPVNESLMEALLILDAMKRASCNGVTLVMPYYGYARQDRKTQGRVPISASAVALLIETMRPARVVAMDLHCGQIQGFFHHIPVDNLFADPLFLKVLEEYGLGPDSVIVSPDAGGVVRARNMAVKLHCDIAIIDKERKVANECASMQLIGDVRGKTVAIVDDMVDTAGTLCKAAELLAASGAAKVFAVATHGVFSGPALDRMNACEALEAVFVTNSIPQAERVQKCPKLKEISVSAMLAEVIRRHADGESISMLFN